MESNSEARTLIESIVEVLPDGQRVLPLVEINNAEDANRAIRRVIAIREYGCRVRQWAAAELHRAEKTEQRLMARYGPHLERWLVQQLAQRKRSQRSIHLPAGTVGLRRSRPQIVVNDEALLVDWCRQHLPDALEASIEAKGMNAQLLADLLPVHCPAVTLSLTAARSVLRQSVEQAGVVPDGVDVRTVEQFYIK